MRWLYLRAWQVKNKINKNKIKRKSIINRFNRRQIKVTICFKIRKQKKI
jgi:hypothetical protein